MSILKKLTEQWKGNNKDFLITDKQSFKFEDLESIELNFLDSIKCGDIVGLIGDFDPISIISLIKLLDIGAIVAPLTQSTETNHRRYFSILKPNYILKNGKIINHSNEKSSNKFIKKLVSENESGLIFFSSGTSGTPKAIIHKTSLLLQRFLTPRKAYKTLNFLMFDHMGGVNTLFHTIYNVGTIVGTKDRSVLNILKICSKFNIEVLPVNPTFLRMMIISGLLPSSVPKSLKIITYGTERMSQITLDQLCALLPEVDFRQTYGLSEFSVLRVKSRDKNSLFMKIGGEGIQTKVVNNILFIKSEFAMLGYLNEQNPFDFKGWFNTKDIVEEDGEYIKIIGRDNDVVNVGGLKFMLADVYDKLIQHSDIEDMIISSKNNSITGQHVEALVQLNEKSTVSKKDLTKYFDKVLPSHMIPKKITFDKIKMNHRLKKDNAK